jgi:structural maintenance of chromosome 3 (chondroitin sulfate proteoglycan 6)
LEISAKTLQAQISGRTTRQEELMRAVKDTTEKFEEAKKQRDQWADRRKALWARQQELEQKRLQQKADLLQEKRTLESTMSRDLVSGLEAVERIKARLPPQHKVYQPLIDLITVREEFTTAMEVVAGNSLFHVVVDTDETAAKVLTELLKERAGRVTCIPLNKVRDQSKVAGIELQQDEEAVRMPDEIEYNIVFRPAINQIFGKTLVCSNLDVATRLSRQHNVACVTLDGQQVSIKGALTGGYHDDRTSRLQSAARQRKLTSAIAETEAELQRISQDLLSLEDKITSSINNMAIHERARSEALHTFESFSDTTRTAHRELLATKETLTKRMHSNKENEAMIQANEESIKALEEEKASSKLFEKLSVEESAELHDLNITLDEIAHRVTVATTRRADLEAQKSQLENQLGGNLLPKQAELESKRESIKLSAYTGATSAQSIQSMKDELKKLEQLQADLTKHHASIEEALKALRMKLQDLQKSVERAQANKEQAQTAAVAKTKRLEKLFNSRMTLLAKRDDLLKRIREIGSLPSKATEDVSRMSHDECVEDLKRTKEDLARFGQVNKKALDQYMSFSSEKEKFSDRRDHMEKELDAIEKLIARLDMQKDEAIGRTFRGVAGNFASVFKEVCPEGEANLIMKVQKSAEEIIGSQERQQQQQKPDRYVGIDMSVKFGSKESRKEGQAIRQLSGGQRTMIALSLIFAIQRCDPAPFYLFDEIDPALDDRYRATIASMVRKQSAETQFIIVTHRPEFVSVAQQNYVVSFSNRVSHVDLVDTDTALEVVAQAEKEQEDMLRKQQQGAKRSKVATAAAPSSAPEEPKEGAESEDDDEVVKIHPRIEDDEPTQFQLEEEDELLDEPKRRPKRGRPSQ